MDLSVGFTVEFLDQTELIKNAPIIRDELASLMTNRAVVGRPSSHQWRFFAACVSRALGDDSPPEFDTIDRIRAAQWKFEVENRLGRFYRRSGKPVRFVFLMTHASQLDRMIGDTDALDYPCLAGYAVLVRDISAEVENSLPDERELKAYLERVVAEACDAEFAAYAALPSIDLARLERCFIKGSPAFNEIAGLIVLHSKKGWVVSNAYNPSHKLIQHIHATYLRRTEARISTSEHWYLRWWSVREERYRFTYRETNRQTYVLRPDGEGWKVFQNLRPAPRTGAPNRRAAPRSNRGVEKDIGQTKPKFRSGLSAIIP